MRAEKAAHLSWPYPRNIERNIERKIRAQQLTRSARLLDLAKLIHRQQRHDHGKVYSVHTPGVEYLLAKGNSRLARRIDKLLEPNGCNRYRYHSKPSLDRSEQVTGALAVV